MSGNIGFSRKIVLKLHNKLRRFHIVLQKKSRKFSLTVLDSQYSTNLQALNTESQTIQVERNLHNGKREFF